MNYAQVHVIVVLMLNVMYKIIIQFVYADQAIREIHNLVALNWNVNRMMNVQMIKRATTMNVSIHAFYPIRAQ